MGATGSTQPIKHCPAIRSGAAGNGIPRARTACSSGDSALLSSTTNRQPIVELDRDGRIVATFFFTMDFLQVRGSPEFALTAVKLTALIA
jgi:hypothetical protein